MSGHSKWSTIKRQKGAVDAKRGALFTRLSREIMMAARQGGGDPSTNFKLRLAVQRAKQSNMPNDNIDRAINKATGAEQTEQIYDAVYEGYGPGGVAILVTAATDNRNRTVSDVRQKFNKAGGSLGEAGSVAWQFEPKGLITIPVNGYDPEELELQAIDAGATDVQVQGDSVEIQTDPQDLETVRQALEDASIEIENADFAMVPSNTIEPDPKYAVQTLKLLDALEDLDDVQRVYSNAEFSDEVLAEFAS
ncbi:MAG: YebC/PmpR family DNA-binding transcriptional regulator [Dehalococcoidia bacterium]|nr:YebC/PmpR family DNA-binding transcriptional regulator [Dehalococcoidia bacterium]